MAAGDFDEFKGMMLAHRKGHENGLVVKVVAAGTRVGREGGPSIAGFCTRQAMGICGEGAVSTLEHSLSRGERGFRMEAEERKR